MDASPDTSGAGMPDGTAPADAAALHARLVRWFEEAEGASAPARRLAERDRDYYDGAQWTAEELAVLRRRRQPAIVVNHVKRKVDFLRGQERRTRSDPKAFPRTPAQDAHADAATQALRYVADDNQFDQVRSLVYENMLVEGFGGAEIVAEPGADGAAEIRIRHVPWDRLFHDPHSRAEDFADARYLGLVVWMDRDEALAAYPDAVDAVELTLSAEGSADTSGYADRPAGAWTDSRRERVRVVQTHWREAAGTAVGSGGGEWWSATLSRGGFLLPPVPSPYLDRQGRRCCPLVLRSAYVDRRNGRYGTVRDLVPLQDEINKRRSKALHLLSVRQVVAQRGAVEDVDAARRELAKPDGYVEVLGPLRFEVQQNADLSAGQFQLLQHATAEMQATGPNAALSGKDPRDLSGRAIQAQQAGGQIELEPIADALRQWTRQAYEAAWMRVRQYWTGERWVRVTGDGRAVRWVGLNRPVTLGEELAALPEEVRAEAAVRLGLLPGDPRLSQVVRVENPVADLDVDITVDSGPDVPTLQAEQFQQLVQMAQSGVAIPPDVLIEASALRNKDALLARLERAQGTVQGTAQGPAQEGRR